jgi:hypothetical protein
VRLKIKCAGKEAVNSTKYEEAEANAEAVLGYTKI